MKSHNKNFTKLKFISFFSLAVLLCVVIFSSFWVPAPGSAPQEEKVFAARDRFDWQQLLTIDQLLHSKWMRLEQLYSEHTSSLANSSAGINNNQATRQIMDAEVSYAKTLDSVSASNAGSSSIEKIDSLVNSFRVALQTRQAINNNISEIALKNINKADDINVDGKKNQDQKLNELLSDLKAKNEMIAKMQKEVSAASASKNSLSINEQKLRQMQIDLQTKTDMIARLQRQVTSMPVKTSNASIDEQKLRELQKEIQSKNAMIAKLQSQASSVSARVNDNSAPSSKDNKKMADELEFLKWALRSEVSSNHALTNSVNQLKQENAALTNQAKGK